VRRASLLSALPDFGFALVFLVTWVSPGFFGDQTVTRLMLVMLLEFIIVHSAVFMGTVIVSSDEKGRRTFALLGLGLFYSIFAAAFSLIFKSLWPFGAFWLQTGNRLLSVLVGQPPSGEEKTFLMKGWAISVALYVACCFITAFLPMPRFGITPGVVTALHLPGSGLWIDEPHRVIAFGFLYFALTGWSELYDHAWLHAESFVRH
jgi:hypothetical protein